MRVELSAADVMETDVMSVAPGLPVIEFEQLVLDARVGGMPVVEGGKVVGIISRSDIIRHLVADQAAEAISTEYYWDLGGSSAVQKSEKDATAADVTLVESMLEDLTVADLMVKEVVSVDPSRPIGEVAQVMATRHVHRILVIERDILLGVITTMDLTRLLAKGRAVATR